MIFDDAGKVLQTAIIGVGAGDGGSRVCSSGGRGGSDGGEGFRSHHDSTDVYYESMIEANPGNALLLSNYAKFLKEVPYTLLVQSSLDLFFFGIRQTQYGCLS